ncbi:MAG: DUF2442 domain-containing protein [Deltaproteobacteria bacterium]|nr:DUF2442 domain-containing protein [Deltaproteobacteria bacterium]
MLIGVKEVQPLSGYKLLLTFENGERRSFDVTPYLETGVFSALKDETIFSSVRVAFDTVERPNGADLCAEVLYGESEPVRIEPAPRRA